MPKFNRYNLEARYVPSLVCSVPFFFLGYYYLSEIDSVFWSSAAGLTVGGIGLSAAMLLVMVNFCRDLGKFIEEMIFDDGLSFPTTTFLLDSDTNLSPSYKKTIIEAIELKFSVNLAGQTGNTVANRRVINEVVRQINSMFFGKNDLLLQRNIQFGFTKNILAGAIIATIISGIGILVSAIMHNAIAMNVAIILLTGYVILALAGISSLRFVARHYAQALYGEFISDELIKSRKL